MFAENGKNNNFCKHSPVDSADTRGIKSFVNVFLHFAQIFKMDHLKWQENEFREKSPAESSDTLEVKTFVEMALPHTDFEINMCTKIQDGHQKWQENNFGGKVAS